MWYVSIALLEGDKDSVSYGIDEMQEENGSDRPLFLNKGVEMAGAAVRDEAKDGKEESSDFPGD